MHMKIVIPVAGMGTRLQPHTFSTPKSLMHVAGKPILGHILDGVQGVDIEEVIFITGPMGKRYAPTSRLTIHSPRDSSTRRAAWTRPRDPLRVIAFRPVAGAYYSR